MAWAGAFEYQEIDCSGRCEKGKGGMVVCWAHIISHDSRVEYFWERVGPSFLIGHLWVLLAKSYARECVVPELLFPCPSPVVRPFGCTCCLLVVRKFVLGKVKSPCHNGTSSDRMPGPKTYAGLGKRGGIKHRCLPNCPKWMEIESEPGNRSPGKISE